MLPWLKRAVLAASALFLLYLCLLELLIGTARLVMWWETRQPDQFYVAYSYLSDGLPWVFLGIVGIWGSAAILSNRSRTLHWLWLPALTLLYFVMAPLLTDGWFFHRAIHPMAGRPIQIALERSQRDLRMISYELTQQAQVDGFYRCSSAQLGELSAFAVNGRQLPYELRCVSTDSDMKSIAPARPATVTMAVSTDGKEAWFRMTTLVSEAGTSADWLRRYGDVLVQHRKLEPAPPNLHE